MDKKSDLTCCVFEKDMRNDDCKFPFKPLADKGF